MEFHFHDNPAFTVAAALAAGMVGQTVAHHLRLPGLVVLLVLGAALGPDLAGIIEPQSLGDGLSSLVGFAVAIILFEGGLSLRLDRLRTEQLAIRRLITVGAAVSLVLGATSAAVVMGWEWQRALLFGTLVIVTGPTVVTPLLRRIKAKKVVSTVLEAEGVLIDAVGAITAAVALELVVSPSGQGAALAFVDVAGRLAFGATVGAVGGLIIAGLLRYRGVIPEGLETVLTLGFTVLVFEAANAVMHETGIAAVTVAGIIVGNAKIYVKHELAEFKEQLTALLIGMLFVLLVADVRLADIMALGWRGAIVAILSIVLIRPLSVVASTWGTELSNKQRAFIAWIGPRGIVAAAVASIFGFEMERAGLSGGTELRALVFVVIAVTVTWSALSGSLAARALGVKGETDRGWVVVGGSSLARRLASLLHEQGSAVLAIDDDPVHTTTYTQAGIEAIRGNALEAETLDKAKLDTRAGAIACTANEDVNYLFGEKARLEIRSIRYAIAVTQWGRGVTSEMIEDFGGEVLFGAAIDVAAWSKRYDQGQALVQWWAFQPSPKQISIFTAGREDAPYIPMVHSRKKLVEPVTLRSRFRRGSKVAFLVDSTRTDEVRKELDGAGWRRVDA